MPELIQINEDVYYLTDLLNHGIIRVGDGESVVIDTGIGDDEAKMILAALDTKDLALTAIINTHSHADHYGGNNYLVKETGCRVYAPPLEAAIMTNPTLESFYLFGASAPRELRQPFMQAKVSPVDVLLEGPSVTIEEKIFNLVPLKGHSPNQMGVLVDDICFCGDSVFSPGAWRKLILVYAVDIGEMIKSIEILKKVPAKSFVPSHVEPMGDIEELANMNLAKIQALIDDILHITRIPAETTTILWEIGKKRGLAIHTLQQYYLCLDTLKAYLSYLLEEDLITYEFDANRLMWLSTK